MVNPDGSEHNQRPDALLWSRRLLFDVTIINCLSETGLVGNIGMAGRLTCQQEEAKRADYAQLAELNNLVVRGFGMDVFGRLGTDAEEVVSTLADVVGDTDDSVLTKAEFSFGVRAAIQAALHVGNAHMLVAAHRLIVG